MYILACRIHWKVSFFRISPKNAQPKKRKPQKVLISEEKSKVKQKMLTIFGTNANGILGKKDSLMANITKFQPGVVFLQETKVSRKGQIKVDNSL